MASTSNPLQIVDDDDEFDWEAAVQEIDVACAITTSNLIPSFSCEQEMVLNPALEMRKKGKFDVKSNSVSSSRQTTLDRFIGVSSSDLRKLVGKAECSNVFQENNRNGFGVGDKSGGVARNGGCVARNGGGVADCEDIEMLNGAVKIDPEAAKTWIYPVNVPLRDYQLSITQTALFSNTLVVLPTGLGKTLIAAVVMYNFFRWFPEGKIVFAAPSRPLVTQQIEACHKIVGIPQEWTIDLTGQIHPTKRAEFWKCKRVFFVTPQVLEKDIQSGSCLVKHLVCLVIDEAHRATGNYSYCVAVRELMDTPVQLRILALSATPGSKQETIQHIINNLQISTLEYRSESDHDVLPYVNERKIELIQVPMGKEAHEINGLLMEVANPHISRLSGLGVLQKRDFKSMSPHDILNSRDKFRQEPPVGLPHINYGEIEGVFGVLITLSHIRKLLSSHGIRPAFEMLDEKLKQGSFARMMSRNEALMRVKLLMQKTVSHGAPSPKLEKMLEVLIDHFKVKDPSNSRVIIFSNFRGSVRDILDALASIGHVVKATEFIGQSSGKTSKGQSQKVQQAVLQKFRTGGYNVIVATSIGEEGLDIMEVDLVICFDANVSPLRMVQRMGRTGRKNEGRVVVLACEGSELSGYMRKKASSNTIKKHMINGGMNSFNFHSSPRMVPHVFRPEVQFVEVSIEEYVPRGKKLKDSDTVPSSAYTNKLTDAEINILAKYFATTRQTSWRPSLIAFPHFQAFPSPINKVPHSSRTGTLIDTMQYLQGLSYSRESKASGEDEESYDPYLRDVAEESHDTVIEGSERSNDPSEDKIEVEGMDIELEEIAKDVHVEDYRKPKTCLHAFLFDSEFVSVNNAGNVLILSLPQLPLESMSQRIEGSKMASAYHAINNYKDHAENLVEGEGDPSWHPRSPECENVENGKLFSGAEEVLHTPVSSRKVTDFCGRDHNVMHDKMLTPPAHESSSDFIDFDLSPRLTNFIESGIVPESPVHNSGTCNGDFVSSQNMQTEFLVDSLGKMDVQCTRDKENQSPLIKCDDNNSLETSSSPIPVAKETQTPVVKISNKSSSEEWLLDSGVKPETVEQQCKLRRLRRLRDLSRKNSPESREQTGPSRTLRTSRMNGHHTPTKHVKGRKKHAKDAAVYIDEEAEVSSEGMESGNEEDEQVNSSYEDSFIDDGTNPASASTQARTDMMAIYRRSLLTQSPFQSLPNSASKSSPDSVVQISRIDISGSSSGAKLDDTPQNGLLSTARNSQFLPDVIPETVENRKRKLSFFQSNSVPMINLEKEFSSFPEAAPENSSMQVERVEDAFDDDLFYEGIDLDAVEEEATKLLRQKTECLTQKEAALSEPVQQNANIFLDTPSFDLGF